MRDVAANLRRLRQEFIQDFNRWGLWRALYSQTMQFIARLLGLRVARINRRAMISDSDISELPAGYTVRRLTDTDYATAVVDVKLEMDAEFVETARASGSYCMGVFYDSDLVAYAWRAFGNTPADDGFSLTIQKPNCYGYKSLTLPEHRGLHLQNVKSRLSDQDCMKIGYTHTVNYIDTHNYASILSYARLGNECVGWISWISRGRLRWCYTSRGARAIGVPHLRAMSRSCGWMPRKASV